MIPKDFKRFQKIPKDSKRFKKIQKITKISNNSCAKNILHSKCLLQLKKLMACPPWKNQRIRGARVAWVPKNQSRVFEMVIVNFMHD